MSDDKPQDDPPVREPDPLPEPSPSSEWVEKGGKPADLETRDRDG